MKVNHCKQCIYCYECNYMEYYCKKHKIKIDKFKPCDDFKADVDRYFTECDLCENFYKCSLIDVTCLNDLCFTRPISHFINNHICIKKI